MRQVWINQNPDEIIYLVADSFEYFEDPREPPITSKEILVQQWQEIKNQKIVSIQITPLIISDHAGSAMYRFEYIDEDSKHQISIGSYYVHVNDQGQATEFRQWWVS